MFYVFYAQVTNQLTIVIAQTLIISMFYCHFMTIPDDDI